MCTTLLAPQMTQFDAAGSYHDPNFSHTANRKLPLSMNWFAVTDEHGNRRLQMRWTVARSSIPPTFRSATPQCVQPAVGRGATQLPARRHE